MRVGASTGMAAAAAFYGAAFCTAADSGSINDLQTRASKLSFADVVKRLAQQPENSLTFISNKARRLPPKSMCLHGRCPVMLPLPRSTCGLRCCRWQWWSDSWWCTPRSS